LKQFNENTNSLSLLTNLAIINVIHSLETIHDLFMLLSMSSLLVLMMLPPLEFCDSCLSGSSCIANDLSRTTFADFWFWFEPWLDNT